MGDTEDELLPTVYAGGYSNTVVGENASLTVKNSNDKTMFQEICMGNGKGSDNKVPYYGNAVLNLDAKPIVRDGVDTVLNSQAEINITAEETTRFYGNDNTTLTLNQASMEDAVVEGVGNIVLKNKACLTSLTQQFKNVALVNGACLDLNEAGNALITGDFAGVADAAAQRGILVLNAEGSLTIEGNVTGTTQFQTGHRLFPGFLLSGKSYIFAKDDGGAEPNFLLAQKNIDNGYELRYETGEWKVYGQPVNVEEIGRIEIVSAPSKVDLRKIPSQEDGSIPDENIYYEIKWYNLAGEEFSAADVFDYYGFYEADYVIRIRTDYWESDAEDILDKTDWYQSVSLMASEEHPGRYYLQAFDGATPGDYTLLFCSESFGDLVTVGDVKALKGTVMAEKRVIFYNEDQQGPEEPDHTHIYQSTVTREPSCTEAGVKTYTCSCGDKYTEKIAALGHQPVTDPRVEPTETEEGKTEGSHCSVCGEILKEQETIPATGKPGEHHHSYESEVTKEATCTEEGIRTYRCECGETYTEQIAQLEHLYVEKYIPATVKDSGKVQKICSVCQNIQNVAVIESPEKIVCSKTDFTYDGKVKTPSVIVKDSKGKSLIKGTDYRVSYSKGRKNPGIYAVTIEFNGKYSGKLTENFTIRPKKTSLKKAAAKSKGIQVTWKKQTVQTDGYEIQYCTTGNFNGKTLKKIMVKKGVTVKKISGLKAKKKYYVRIRTYKTVKVNGKNRNLYSNWSGKKTVRTKR